MKKRSNFPKAKCFFCDSLGYNIYLPFCHNKSFYTSLLFKSFPQLHSKNHQINGEENPSKYDNNLFLPVLNAKKNSCFKIQIFQLQAIRMYTMGCYSSVHSNVSIILISMLLTCWAMLARCVRVRVASDCLPNAKSKAAIIISMKL